MLFTLENVSVSAKRSEPKVIYCLSVFCSVLRKAEMRTSARHLIDLQFIVAYSFGISFNLLVCRNKEKYQPLFTVLLSKREIIEDNIHNIFC